MFGRDDRVCHRLHRGLTGTVAGRANAAGEVFVTWDSYEPGVGEATWIAETDLLWLPADVPR